MLHSDATEAIALFSHVGVVVSGSVEVHLGQRNPGTVQVCSPLPGDGVADHGYPLQSAVHEHGFLERARGVGLEPLPFPVGAIVLQ